MNGMTPKAAPSHTQKHPLVRYAPASHARDRGTPCSSPVLKTPNTTASTSSLARRGGTQISVKRERRAGLSSRFP